MPRFIKIRVSQERTASSKRQRQGFSVPSLISKCWWLEMLRDLITLWKINSWNCSMKISPEDSITQIWIVEDKDQGTKIRKVASVSILTLRKTKLDRKTKRGISNSLSKKNLKLIFQLSHRIKWWTKSNSLSVNSS